MRCPSLHLDLQSSRNLRAGKVRDDFGYHENSQFSQFPGRPADQQGPGSAAPGTPQTARRDPLIDMRGVARIPAGWTVPQAAFKKVMLSSENYRLPINRIKLTVWRPPPLDPYPGGCAGSPGKKPSTRQNPPAYMRPLRGRYHPIAGSPRDEGFCISHPPHREGREEMWGARLAFP